MHAKTICNIIKKMLPVRTARYDMHNRIALGHVQTVHYIVAITIRGGQIMKSRYKQMGGHLNLVEDGMLHPNLGSLKMMNLSTASMTNCTLHTL